jgi:hypothetical protein
MILITHIHSLSMLESGLHADMMAHVPPVLQPVSWAFDQYIALDANSLNEPFFVRGI